MENIVNNLQQLRIQQPQIQQTVEDIDFNTLSITPKKYGIIAIINCPNNFTPETYTFQIFKTNIHKTSLLLKNNQLVLFEDSNPYILQYEITQTYKITEDNIRHIYKHSLNNITLYCVIVNNIDLQLDESYNWNHLYDFFDAEIYKYPSLYKYLIDDSKRLMNKHIDKEITINYIDNNLTYLEPFIICLYEIYKCLADN